MSDIWKSVAANAMVVLVLVVLSEAVLHLLRRRRVAAAKEHIKSVVAESRLVAELRDRLLDTIPAMIILIDPLGTITSLNNCVRHTLGWDPDSPPDPDLLAEAFPGDELRQRISRNAQADHDAWFEAPMLHRNGNRLQTRWLLSRLSDASTLAIGIDRTEQRRTENKIRRTARRLQLATDAAAIGTWATDAELSTLEWDSRMFDIYGIEPGLPDLPAQWRAAVHPDDRPRVLDLVRACLDSSQDFHAQFRIVRPDGETRHIEAHGGVQRDERGRICGMTGANWDVTARERATNRIAHLNRVLLAIRDINKLIVHERDTQRLLDGTCELLVRHRGYQQALIVRTNPEGAILAHAVAGSGGGFSQDIEHLQIGGIVPCYRKSHENDPNCCRSCFGFDQDDTVKCLKLLHAGTLHGFLVVNLASGMTRDSDETDILKDMANDVAMALRAAEQEHHVHQAENARRQAEDQLLQAQKMESIGRLAGGVAHDFNNLLTVILGQVQLLGLQLLEPAQRRRLDEIEDAAARATSLTSQLLAFSRRQVLQTTRFDANQQLSTCTTMLVRLLGEDVRLLLQLGPGPYLVDADPGQFDQVIMNLAINGRDALADSGGQLTIQTRHVVLHTPPAGSLLEPGDHLRLDVTDTGSGMDPVTMQHIFEPFYTTKTSGKGTGLGLAMVHGIINQFGGHITVQSQPGAGTTFTIWLPMARNEDSTPSTPQKTDAADAGGSETVLLVEDDFSLRSLIAEVLQLSGYTVLTAENGEHALDLVNQAPEPIHLVISDVIMPGMRGTDLVREVHAIDPRIRLLLVSGYDERVSELTQPFRDTNRYLQKPFTPDELLIKVRDLLNQQPLGLPN